MVETSPPLLPTTPSVGEMEILSSVVEGSTLSSLSSQAPQSASAAAVKRNIFEIFISCHSGFKDLFIAGEPDNGFVRFRPNGRRHPGQSRDARPRHSFSG
jgi:hypothetical protein